MTTDRLTDGDVSGTEAALRGVRSRHELMAVLLAADLFMPASGTVTEEGRVRRLRDAATVRYPVIVEGDERLVPVFTSEAGVLAALPEADRPYVVARGAVLLAGWPPDATLYLDPGGERASKIPGLQVATLREDVLRTTGPASPEPRTGDASAGRPEREPGAHDRPDAGASAGESGAAHEVPATQGRSWLERLGLRRPS